MKWTYVNYIILFYTHIMSEKVSGYMELSLFVFSVDEKEVRVEERGDILQDA